MGSPSERSASRSRRALHASPAEQIAELALLRPPTLGSGRLIVLDGPAGAGKTTLAAQVAELTGAAVVHMDNLYDGWNGLSGVGPQLGTLLEPLAQGVPGSYRRYDWHAGAFAETVTVPPADLLVLEGVGSGLAGRWATVTVWVAAPAELRRVRAARRDGDDAWWDTWAAAEDGHFARHPVAADLSFTT